MSKKNKDYFRRPQMFADKKQKDYASMMRNMADRVIWTKSVEKHSEFKKPYQRYAENYPEMEYFHPSNFVPAYKFIVPDIPTTPSDTPAKDICDGAVMMAMVGSVSLTCGSQTSLMMGGHTGDGTPWAPSDLTWAFAYPSSARGSIQGGTYSAPPCSALEKPTDCMGIEETIMGLTPCGRSTKIIAVIVPAGCDPCLTPATLELSITSYSYATTVIGMRFQVIGGTPPYTWTLEFPDSAGSSAVMIDEGFIYGGWMGRITALSGDCGTGIVTCTDSCGWTGTLEVRGSAGLWNIVQTFVGEDWLSGPWGSYNEYHHCFSLASTIWDGPYMYNISRMGCGNGANACAAFGAPCPDITCSQGPHPAHICYASWAFPNGFACQGCVFSTSNGTKSKWGCP